MADLPRVASTLHRAELPARGQLFNVGDNPEYDLDYVPENPNRTMSPSPMPAKKLRILFFREGDWWIAQCLDHDIVAQAKDGLREAEYELERLIVSHILASQAEGLEPFAGIPPAPPRMQEKWANEAEPIQLTKLPNFRGEGMPEPHVLQASSFDARVC